MMRNKSHQRELEEGVGRSSGTLKWYLVETSFIKYFSVRRAVLVVMGCKVNLDAK